MIDKVPCHGACERRAQLRVRPPRKVSFASICATSDLSWCCRSPHRPDLRSSVRTRNQAGSLSIGCGRMAACSWQLANGRSPYDQHWRSSDRLAGSRCVPLDHRYCAHSFFLRVLHVAAAGSDCGSSRARARWASLCPAGVRRKHNRCSWVACRCGSAHRRRLDVAMNAPRALVSLFVASQRFVALPSACANVREPWQPQTPR